MEMPPTKHKATTLCGHFARGKCDRGDERLFAHPVAQSSPFGRVSAPNPFGAPNVSIVSSNPFTSKPVDLPMAPSMQNSHVKFKEKDERPSSKMMASPGWIGYGC